MFYFAKWPLPVGPDLFLFFHPIIYPATYYLCQHIVTVFFYYQLSMASKPSLQKFLYVNCNGLNGTIYAFSLFLNSKLKMFICVVVSKIVIKYENVENSC